MKDKMNRFARHIRRLLEQDGMELIDVEPARQGQSAFWLITYWDQKKAIAQARTEHVLLNDDRSFHDYAFSDMFADKVVAAL